MLLLLPAVLLLAFSGSDGKVSKKEKRSAAKFLKETERGVLESVEGLSEAQLKFKSAPDKWSVEDCLKHIAVTEGALWQMAEGALKQAANPEKRVDIKMSDDDVRNKVEDRSTKVKTFTPFEPQNTTYKTAAEAIAAFKEKRAKLIDYIKHTDEALRNHVVALPFGSLDAYQMVLFVGAHSNRHMQQINEVKADPNFPKN